MTLCTNFASYLHQPGKRLFDVGFVIVPELGRASRLEPVSDVLTGAMPVVAFVYIMFFLDRRRRCRCLTDWFRMMTVVAVTGARMLGRLEIRWAVGPDLWDPVVAV